MKKYNEIIDLNRCFKPYYDITNESDDYWKAFIVNEKFYNLLNGVLNSLEGQTSKDKKSIWVQGTYGTGKSHATGVIKHLLFEPLEKIDDFLKSFESEQTKFRLKKFRENHRVFPVVIKGVSNITNNSSFSLEIEKSVKSSLEKYGISIETKSDFEKVINQIEKNPLHIDWDRNIQNHAELRMYVNNKEDLINKLKQYDQEIFQILEDLSLKTSIHFSQEKIEEWLVEIINELQKANIADKLIIYWDEFTSVLELQNSGILLAKLQDIAELSANKGIYLFVVSHRKPHQTRLKQEDIDHILGRFESLDYSMEPITTYHIIGAAIQKKNSRLWEQLRDKNNLSVDNIIKRISRDEGSFVTTMLRNLFPIHPYTAYLSTFIARNIGSTERSIFNFLYDQDKGFVKFINENPTPNGGDFLLVDYLFDFFLEGFEKRNDQRFYPVLDKFKLYSKTVENENENYCAIFKGVLLLNILYKMVNIDESYNSLLSPNLENINALFCGSKYLSNIDNCLEFFHTKQILSRNPDNLFLVESSALPYREIEKEKNLLRNNYNTINKILSTAQQNDLISHISSSILRRTEILIFDSSLTEYYLKNFVLKNFNCDYTIHIVLLISRNLQDLAKAQKNINSILSEDMFENIIFVILDELLTQEKIESFLDYHARAVVADRHNLKEEQNNNLNYATKLFNQWIQSAKSSNMDWFLKIKDEEKILYNKTKVLLSDFAKIVNEVLSLKIFPFGIENLNEVRKNINAWTFQMSKTSAENFIFAEDLNFIEQKTTSGPARYTREILKNNSGQYIVQDNLIFFDDIDQDHPIFKMWNEIHLDIDNKRGEIFNLGESLNFLSKPPFGLYPNIIHMAALGFLLRSYVGKLYEAGTGKPIEKEIMRDKILNIFEYWTKKKDANKLDVRLGTEEEKNLLLVLCEIFDLGNKESLNDTKWAIRDWIKSKVKFPLWIFKTVTDISQPALNAIDDIIFFVQSIEQNFTQQNIKNIYESISNVKTDLVLLFQKYEICNDLFIKWLDNIDTVKIKVDRYFEVIDYVRQNLPEEIFSESWTEDKVREIVKDWFIKRGKTDGFIKAKFVTQRLSEYAPFQVHFIDESEGNPISWEWNFDLYGSGTFSDEKHPIHTYEKAGTYTVRLKVTNSDGNNDLLIEDYCIKNNDIPDLENTKLQIISQKIRSIKEGDLKNLIIEIITKNKEFLNTFEKYLNA